MNLMTKDEPQPYYFKRLSRWKLTVFLLFFILILVIILSVAIGPMQISPLNVYSILTKNIPILGDMVQSNASSVETEVILQVRLPRVFAAAIVGIALTCAGVVLQGLLRNPMADPYILGISAGASLGASVAIAFGFGISFLGYLYSIPLMAFIGALGTILVVYSISSRAGGLSMLTLLLIGIAANSFLSAIVALVKLISSEALHGIVYWILGSLQVSGWNHVVMVSPLILIGAAVIYVYARDLNLISLGESQAKHLGVDAESLNKKMLICASLITAAAVSISGIIGFIGLIIPHITRLLVGPDHRILIPSSALLGAIVLIVCDTVSRTVMSPAEIPVGIITALLGCPFFVYLLLKKRSSFGRYR